MKNLKIHSNFSLNGKQFSAINELLVYSKTLSSSAFSFLSEWFDDKNFVTVKTSGSTGKPKRLQLQKQHMIQSAIATGTFFNLPKKTTVLLCLSTDYIAGKMMLVRALTLGWHLDSVAPSSHPLNGVEKSYDFTAMVPLQLFNSIDRIDGIKKLIVGGGVVSTALQQKISYVNTAIFATYGMTETCTHIAVKKLNNYSNVTLSTSSELSTGSVERSFYKVLPNIKISKDSRDCLVIDAPYICNDIITTNDLVEIIAESEFNWLGRYDTIINSGGVKLIPEQIEEKLTPILDYRFLVAGVADAVLGEKLILIIENTNNEITTIEQARLRNDIKSLSTLSKFETPKEIYFIEKFIETGTKKIDRNKTIATI